MNFSQLVDMLNVAKPKIIQWLMRSLYTLLIAHMAANQADTWISIVSQVAVVLFAMGIDWLTHTKYYERKDVPPADDPPTGDNGKLPMVAWLIVGCLFMGAVAGCASTEENRIAQGYVFTRTVAQETRAAYISRAISVQTAADILIALETYQDALNEYRKQLQIGNPDAVSRANAAVIVALTNLNDKYAAIPKTGPPTTRPG